MPSGIQRQGDVGVSEQQILTIVRSMMSISEVKHHMSAYVDTSIVILPGMGAFGLPVEVPRTM